MLDPVQTIAAGKCSMKALIMATTSIDAMILLSTLICDNCGLLNPYSEGSGKCGLCRSQLHEKFAKCFKYLGDWLCHDHSHRHEAYLVGNTLLPGEECEGYNHLLSVAKKNFELNISIARTIYWQHLRFIKSHPNFFSKEAIKKFIKTFQEVLEETFNMVQANSTLMNKKVDSILNMDPEVTIAAKASFALIPGAISSFRLDAPHPPDMILATCRDEIITGIT